MLSIHDHHLAPAELFRVVWTGWFYGVVAMFLPFAAAVTVLVAFSRPAEAGQGLLAVILVPLIAAGQGVIVGGIVLLGLWIHRRVVDRPAPHGRAA